MRPADMTTPLRVRIGGGIEVRIEVMSTWFVTQVGNGRLKGIMIARYVGWKTSCR